MSCTTGSCMPTMRMKMSTENPRRILSMTRPTFLTVECGGGSGLWVLDIFLDNRNPLNTVREPHKDEASPLRTRYTMWEKDCRIFSRYLLLLMLDYTEAPQVFPKKTRNLFLMIIGICAVI